jgi:hypothetical protein
VDLGSAFVPRSVKATHDDGYLVAGATTRSKLFGNRKSVLVKLSKGGSLLWAKEFGKGGKFRDFIADVAEMPGGTIRVAGFSESYARNSTYDMFLSEIRAEGNLQQHDAFKDVGTISVASVLVDVSSVSGGSMTYTDLNGVDATSSLTRVPTKRSSYTLTASGCTSNGFKYTSWPSQQPSIASQTLYPSSLFNTNAPSPDTTDGPTTIIPTNIPSSITASPTIGGTEPSSIPTTLPTSVNEYVVFQTSRPTEKPSIKPSRKPTQSPTKATTAPTRSPTLSPTRKPTFSPTGNPTQNPTPVPVSRPTRMPSEAPTLAPSHRPTSASDFATFPPTHTPTVTPSIKPPTSKAPSDRNSTPKPSSARPSASPTSLPSSQVMTRSADQARASNIIVRYMVLIVIVVTVTVTVLLLTNVLMNRYADDEDNPIYMCVLCWMGCFRDSKSLVQHQKLSQTGISSAEPHDMDHTQVKFVPVVPGDKLVIGCASESAKELSIRRPSNNAIVRYSAEAAMANQKNNSAVMIADDSEGVLAGGSSIHEIEHEDSFGISRQSTVGFHVSDFADDDESGSDWGIESNGFDWDSEMKRLNGAAAAVADDEDSDFSDDDDTYGNRTSYFEWAPDVLHVSDDSDGSDADDGMATKKFVRSLTIPSGPDDWDISDGKVLVDTTNESKEQAGSSDRSEEDNSDEDDASVESYHFDPISVLMMMPSSSSSDDDGDDT